MLSHIAHRSRMRNEKFDRHICSHAIGDGHSRLLSELEILQNYSVNTFIGLSTARNGNKLYNPGHSKNCAKL